ncbi:MAG: Esterase/lipase [Thermoleophilia bacterium]|jgi:acetyl esterase/lipase|nr:Esterase/lipase [Thermoleophilia bacterium]
MLLLGAAAAAEAAHTRVNDVRYVSRGALGLTLDLYRPTTGRDRPIVVLMHGGGWWSSDKREVESSAVDLVERGFVVANVNYRLTCGTPDAPRRAWGYGFNDRSPLCGPHHVPEQLADVHAAVDFMRAYGRRYGGNPQRMALVGSSAGGHLALLAAATRPAARRVQAVVNWSGPTSTASIPLQDHRLAGTIKGSFTNAIGCPYEGECIAKWDAASPQLLISRKTPRFAVLNSVSERERQVTRASMTDFHRHVRRLGWRAELVVARGDCHSRACLATPPRDGRATVNDRSMAFLRRHL